jgi:hypothetical protein
MLKVNSYAKRSLEAKYAVTAKVDLPSHIHQSPIMLVFCCHTVHVIAASCSSRRKIEVQLPCQSTCQEKRHQGSVGEIGQPYDRVHFTRIDDLP